ncbi:cytosolic endo-beta-N-acetylglucosaminidase [Terrapene carolina triunguis]|uniref:cytosolic endo-beta-N-acetylglucosaminidase n=1 Tax=Terrapene triunguis TaxID=2587831 RepID=UPI001156B0E4|nr:cytosolic endo-beta-N-acetylglucosaminidase [Terrapene carolina triunguis]
MEGPWALSFLLLACLLLPDSTLSQPSHPEEEQGEATRAPSHRHAARAERDHEKYHRNLDKQPPRSQCVRCCNPPTHSSAYPMYQPLPHINITILKGEKGDRGERGLQGKFGKAGSAGSRGHTGPKGQKGSIGATGEACKSHYAAFSVGRKKPLHSNDYYQTLLFDTEFVNLYDHFNMFTGKFYCYVPGIYYFALNVHTWNQKETYLHMVKNGVEVVILYAQQSDRSIMQSQSVMLELQEQDEVWVRLFKGERENAVFSDEYDTYVTFSGYLIKHSGELASSHCVSPRPPSLCRGDLILFFSFLPAMGSQGSTILHKTVSYAPHALPARQFDQNTTEPISFYLSSLEELLAWKPTSDDDFNVATMPLANREPPLHSKRPRTLVCHDMNYGYLEDRFIQGSASRDPYVFYHWQYIDIFVYFSHHPVTIPPVTWTNAAHRNGVSVLGTFITEQTSGVQLCEAFLAGEAAAYHAVAVQLGRIAHFYRFDGWLVNIENTLSEAAARNLPLFLRDLREQLHRDVPGGLVIWYDSVLPSGKLQWQNELNEKNRVFFDACDGFFTNYNWKEEHLERMGAQAGERLADVYVGIDVFARGEVVGGGFETDKALRLIRKHGFSAAIFAPGWVYEHLGKENFLQNENKFWGLLAELLPTHSISTLPFSTCFCLGMGTGRFSAGQEEEVRPWYNLSAQEIQPLFTEQQAPGGAGSWLCTRCSLQDAWNGGSSLLIEGIIPPEAGHVAVRCQLPPSSSCPCCTNWRRSCPRWRSRWNSPHGTLAPAVLATKLPCRGRPPDISPSPSPPRPPSSLGCSAAVDGRARQVGRGGECPQPGSRPASGLVSPAALPVLPSLPSPRCYELELRDCALHELSLILSRHQPGQQERRFSCRLGEIRVLDADGLRSSLPQGPSLQASQLLWHKGPGPDQLSLSLTLRWSYPHSQARCFRIHCQGRAGPRGRELPQLLGVAHATLYRVVGLAVPEVPPTESCRVEFFVEPVLNEGVAVDRSRWGRLVLVYSDPANTSTY